MLITPEYCLMMARYNAWQNAGLRKIVEAMPKAELDKDRGAFFGSIRGTLNHILWADQLWMSRLAGGVAPEAGIAESTELTPTIAAWGAERFRTDGRMTLWAEAVTAVELAGEYAYHSKVMGGEIRKPMGQLVAHLFNHQTHHRGQVHAMLTAAGKKPGDTDLAFLPDLVSD